MPKPRVPSSSPPNDGPVMLDVRHLKALRQRRPAPEAQASQFESRRQKLVRAAIGRTEAGKPVGYRTARRLAAFHGVTVDALIDPRPAHTAQAAGACDDVAGIERLQCRAVIEAVRSAGCGRLVDVLGARGSGKSRLVDACVLDARAAGYACAVLRGNAVAAAPPQPAATLMLALLGLDGAKPVGPSVLAARVRERCWTLGLPAAHIDACLSLLEGARRWPLPAVHLLQTAALCALVQHCARTQPLLVAVDGMHGAGWQLAMMLNVLVPATLEFPVLWLFAGETRPAPTQPARGARLDAVARTTLHLAPPPARRDSADVASVHRIGRSAPPAVAAFG